MMEAVGSIMERNIRKRGDLLNVKINGFTQIPNSFLIYQDIDVYEKMVMIILKKYMMNKTRCWPSHNTIAKEIPCSETTVKETINSLENRGLLTKGRDKKHRSNWYEIKM